MRSALLLTVGWLASAPAAASPFGRSDTAHPVGPAPADMDGGEVGDSLLAVWTEGGVHPGIRWPDFSDVRDDLVRFYTARGWQPAWVAGDTVSTPARALIPVLQEAEHRGLSPEDYDAAWLSSQAAAAAVLGADGDWRARLDLAFSISAARFALALRRGRVSPEEVHGALHLGADSFDLAATLDTLARTSRPNDVLRGLEPPFLHYWLLMASLVRYRALARDSALVSLPPMPRRLRPGQSYAGVPTLRRLLRLLGDARDSLPVPIYDTLYTGPLVEAVKRFQARQGFQPDGVIGDSTQARLGSPFDQRIRQMELALERWRWMPRRYQVPPIIVNIPAFRLEAFRTLDLAPSGALTMEVVVGTAFETETPVFASMMEYLTFSPYWDVTATIARHEILPAAQADPEFLVRNGYELVAGKEVLPPWPEYIGLIGNGVRVRQVPGPHNALGRVKFIMPNEHQVYLHDTPARRLFGRSRRDASHGCIRVGNPMGLARFLLRDQPEWTAPRMKAAAESGVPVTVRLRQPVPVYLTYATAVARENGDVFFYSDIYGHDRLLDRLLRQGYPYSRPAPPPAGEGPDVTAGPP